MELMDSDKAFPGSAKSAGQPGRLHRTTRMPAPTCPCPLFSSHKSIAERPLRWIEERQEIHEGFTALTSAGEHW
jgi:hypothetical protein